MNRVLVLDGMWNKSLAAVRSLGRRGFYVAAGERTLLAAALFSRYCDRRVVYPSPVRRTGEFLNWIKRETEEHGYDVVLPTELSTQTVLTSNRDVLPDSCRLPFAGTDLCMKVQDKAFLMKYAKGLGIDTPETFFVDDISRLHDLAENIRYPSLVKPRSSSGSRGIVHVEKKEDFVPSYLKVHGSYPFPLVQEYVPRTAAVGVCVLLNNESKVRASFVYRKLREYPIKGGPSTLRESIRMDAVREIAEALLEQLKWTGVAHVEFIIDSRDGKPRLIEVNPRFWGSLQLAVEAGVDFPYLLFQSAVEGDIRPVTDYRTGVMCRCLVPGELLHFMDNPHRFKIRPGLFDMSIKDDVLSFKDPMPVVGRVLSGLSFLYDREMRGILRK